MIPYAAVEIALYESLKLEYIHMYTTQPPAWVVLLLGTANVRRSTANVIFSSFLTLLLLLV